MNSRVSIVRYAAIEGKGWRHGPVVYQTVETEKNGKKQVRKTNGKLKTDYMIFGGKEVHAPNGRYQLLRYEGRRPVYVNIGNDPADALNRFRAEESRVDARAKAVAAGLEVVTPEQSRKKTLKQYAADYIQMHEDLPHRSDDSVRVYTQVTTSFIAQCKALYPELVTKEDVIRWHSWMRTVSKYSDRTAANHYMALRGYLKYCGLKPGEIIPKGTHKLLKQYTRKSVTTYTPEVVQRLIEASTTPHRALLWDFLYKSGIRDSEARMVTRDDLHGLDGDNPMLHVRERDEYGNIKDAEERKVELHPSLVPALKQWLKDHPKKRLLFGTRNDEPDTKMLLALKATARRAGINCGHCSGCKGQRNECREFTLHRFRRTYTSQMLVATQGDLRGVMTRTGHSDLASVMRYLAPVSDYRIALSTAL